MEFYLPKTMENSLPFTKDGVHYDVHIYNPLTEEIEHHLNVTATEAERLAPVHFQFIK